MVVASGNRTRDADHGVKNITNCEDTTSAESEETSKMTAKGILICRENSHAFQERTLNLNQAVKIGRSVARARVATNNAIFDCKVLSRNHALLWYNAGKFYLQDTRSSNGTFVNNHRLSTTGLESAPREVCSGDIVQFGVDVMETTKKVTHGCIVATLKLYLPDGKEAKASRAMSIGGPAGDVSLEDLYKLNQYVQEASRREKVLQGKLSHLQTLVENTRLATDQSWKALIDEDRLLARVKTVESQLVACSKNIGEDKIRNELVRLEEEKAQYQIAAKEALRKIHQEKLEVTQKLAQLESRLNETEEECQSLHDVSKHAQLELQELAAKYTDAQRNLQFMENKLVEKEESSSEIVKWAMQEKKDLLKKVEEQAKVERFLQARLRNCWLEDPVNIPKHIAAMRNYMQTLVDMNPKLTTETETPSKEAVNPIEAINSILNKLEAMLAEMNCDAEMMTDTNIANTENDDNQTKDNETKSSLIIENTDNYDKNELDDSPNKHHARITVRRERSNDSVLLMLTKVKGRRTLVNGSANLDESTESDGTTNSNDDTSSVASDDTWVGFLNDDSGDKSIIEVKQLDNEVAPPCETEPQRESQISRECGQKLEVRFASGTNGKDLEEVHYDHAYRPEEEFADVADVADVATAANDDDSSDSIESPNESIAAPSTATEATARDTRDTRDTRDKENEENEDIERVDCLELDDENVDGDYIKTLKPLSNPASPSSSQTREYILRTLINSLESLRGSDDDHEAQREVKRELDELRDWLVQETSENIVNKLRELYYRAKNENQRIQEVNEELVILKEKYNAISDEKTELLKQYKSLKAQCGDLLNTSYSVPIQYVAPIAAVIVWMLLEKMF